MDTSILALALTSSTLTIGYLARGLYLYIQKWPSIAKEDEPERDRLVRIQLNHLYPDHVMYTLFLSGMAIAVDMPYALFPLIITYFAIVKGSKGFGFLNVEKKHSASMRNLGLFFVVLPMIGLSVFCFLKSVLALITT